MFIICLFVKFKFIKLLICQRAAPGAALFFCNKVSSFAVSVQLGHAAKLHPFLKFENFSISFFSDKATNGKVYTKYIKF